MTTVTAQTLGLKDIAERYGVNKHTVLNWIDRGILRAIDVSRVGACRPHYRITNEALTDFENLRSPKPKPVITRRRKATSTSEIRFYK